MFPIRCFSCGGVISEVYEEYVSKLKEGEDLSNALDDLGIKKYCCRRMFISHSIDENGNELFDEVMKY
jgi:DNA-directed RNA polymerase subunit N